MPSPTAARVAANPDERPLEGDAARRRTPPLDPEPAPTPDGGLWRGPTEGHWIARLLHGAPAPRDPTPTPMPGGRPPVRFPERSSAPRPDPHAIPRKD